MRAITHSQSRMMKSPGSAHKGFVSSCFFKFESHQSQILALQIFLMKSEGPGEKLCILRPYFCIKMLLFSYIGNFGFILVYSFANKGSTLFKHCS